MTIAVESKPELEQLKWLMEEAEKKITTAISEAAAKLDLNSLQLINVTVSLQLATTLVKLDLSNNNLEVNISVRFPMCSPFPKDDNGIFFFCFDGAQLIAVLP